ncbi:hypothetical protein ACH5RR_026197 [Cinchona calisaya]|uniref:Uncharacterized protein n=1 Tax=Cinchona calisaya TaxID=153742 RepID=A0ABD2Z593_9GENT
MAAIVHDVETKTIAASSPIINATVCLGSVDDSAAISEFNTAHLAAAWQRKLEAATAAVISQDTASSLEGNKNAEAQRKC